MALGATTFRLHILEYAEKIIDKLIDDSQLLGAVITVSGRPTFTSKHTVEVQVMVDAEHPCEGMWARYRVVEAYFVEVPLDQMGNLMTVPPLQVWKFNS